MKHFLFLAVCLFMNAFFSRGQVGSWSNTGPITFPGNASGQVNGIGRVSQIKFHPTNSQKMYAVSASGGLYISTNNGGTWAVAGTDKLPQSSCSAVCVDYTNDRGIL